jgi:hypothetical protein
VFGLAFVVEVVVGYNPIMHKTQLQKLIFLAFCSFLMGPILKPQPSPLKQTPSKKGLRLAHKTARNKKGNNFNQKIELCARNKNCVCMLFFHNIHNCLKKV